MEATIERIATDKAPGAIGPYCQAVAIGNLVFASGQIPIDPATGTVVEGGIEEQTKQVMRNMEAVLAAAGSGMDRVVKSTVFIRDMKAFSAINAIYAEHFTGPVLPARSVVEVSALPKGVLIEMEVVAVRSAG
jgi:2-iminobutanoate/2-iminopropanoate deaminase